MKLKKFSLGSDDYLRQSIIVFFFTTASFIVNYLFQIFFNRNLTPDEFGLLGSFLSALSLLGAFLTPVSQWMIKVFSEIKLLRSKSLLKYKIREFYQKVFIVLILLVIFVYLGADQTLSFVKTDQKELLIIFLFLMSIQIAVLPILSIVYGFGNFLYRGFISLTNDSLIFLLIGTLSIIKLQEIDVRVALLVKTLALFSSLLLGVYIILRLIKKELSEDDEKNSTLQTDNLRVFLTTGLGTIGLLFVIHVDMIVARATMTPFESGVYATVSIFGKALFFLSTLTLPVFYTKSLEAHNQGKPMAPVILRGFGLVVISVIAGLIGLYIFLEPFVSVLNPKYTEYLPQIWSYAKSMIPYAFLNFMIILVIAKDRHLVFYPLLLLVFVQAAVLYVTRGTVDVFINYRLLFGWGYVALFLVYFLFGHGLKKLRDND